MRSLEQIAADLLGHCRYRPGPMTAGLGSSNTPKVLDQAETDVVFLDVRLDAIAPSGCDGMATVHVYARERPVVPVPVNANSKVRVVASWQSVRAGGEIEIDGAHGAFLCLGANTAVNLRARLVSAVEGEEVVIGSTYEMEAVVKWYTSPGADRPIVGLPARTNSEAGGVTTFFKIPAQARTMSAFAVNPAAYATLVGELATVDAAGAVRYATLVAPRGELVVNGVEWVRLRSATITPMFPAFELWA